MNDNIFSDEFLKGKVLNINSYLTNSNDVTLTIQLYEIHSFNSEIHLPIMDFDVSIVELLKHAILLDNIQNIMGQEIILRINKKNNVKSLKPIEIFHVDTLHLPVIKTCDPRC